MQYETMEELSSTGYVGKVYSVSVVVLTVHVEGDIGTTEANYWEDSGPDGVFYHPFERVFDNRVEAIEYARTFDKYAAIVAHERGNGRLYDTVAVDVVEDYVPTGASEGVVVFTREWNLDDTFDEIEWDENGVAHYTSPDKEFEEWANTHNIEDFFGDGLE